MQEAYRPLHKKYMLCCSSWGYPDMGPDLDGRYSPVLTWDGVGVPPVLTWNGVPPIREGGVPSYWEGRGVPPVLTWDGGSPHQEGWEYPSPLERMGTPSPSRRMVYPPSPPLPHQPDGGTFPSAGCGYPPPEAKC